MNRINLGNQHWLEIILNKALREETKEAARKHHSQFFHPSQAGMCPRALWYFMKGYTPERPTITSQKALSMGSTFHSMIETVFKKTGLVHSIESIMIADPDDLFNQYNVPVPISGTYDVVIFDPFKRKYLIEVKSHKDSLKDTLEIDYNDLTTVCRWDYLTSPEVSHTLQWQLYAYLSEIPQGCILYINRNDLRFKIFEQTLDLDIVYNIFEKYDDILEHIKKDIIYPYQPKENHYWCPFNWQCHQDYALETLKQ